MMFDSDTGWVVAITGGFSTLFTLACTKGVEALLRIRKAKADELMAGKQQEASQDSIAFQEAKAAYDKLQAALEARVLTLETSLQLVTDKLEKSQNEHVKCMVGQEALRGDIKLLQAQIDRLKDHDKANAENVSGLKKQLNNELAKKEAS